VQECPSVFQHRLHHLPSCMTEVFGRPENVEDVLAVLSATSALEQCYEAVIEAPEAATAFQAMTSWLTRMSGHFNNLVSQRVAAALVVLAHWTVLVKKAESCGCWYLSGLAQKIMSFILEQLPRDEGAVMDLVEGL
jgi:hypothetical protein